ncbi:MAG: hypothetical protein IKS33_00100 [Bacteroidales bacterium]|nr:hypothetical protein [Bacteroidales bacterium]
MKKKSHTIFRIVIFTVITLFIISLLFNDPDNIRISKKIYYNIGRKDILDYNGKYEIPPKVLDYCKKKNIIFIKWQLTYPLTTEYKKYDYYKYLNDGILYWIIDLNNEEQIGPMDLMEFNNYCKTKDIIPSFKSSKSKE